MSLDQERPEAVHQAFSRLAEQFQTKNPNTRLRALGEWKLAILSFSSPARAVSLLLWSLPLALADPKETCNPTASVILQQALCDLTEAAREDPRLAMSICQGVFLTTELFAQPHERVICQRHVMDHLLRVAGTDMIALQAALAFSERMLTPQDRTSYKEKVHGALKAIRVSLSLLMSTRPLADYMDGIGEPPAP